MSLNAFVRPSIFREYIGSGPDTLKGFPGEIINPRIPQFHFILSFASEDYVNGKGTGLFLPTWNLRYFGPDHIRKLKREHPNVKVVISIGGHGLQYPFNPIEKEIWIDNAVRSIEDIIKEYDQLIDGIDIFYDRIDTTPPVFADYIGDLLQYLKKKIKNDVVSIAPSPAVLTHYTFLYKTHRDIIDLVDYQFYREKLPTKLDFENRFLELYDIFESKLLAGFSTDPNDKGNLSLYVFIEGCIDLIRRALLSGIFVWDANYSVLDEPPFIAEIKSQSILTPYDDQSQGQI